MSDLVKIKLTSLNETVEVKRWTPLKDVLFKFGVEFPCGGHGRCRGCRVRVIEGTIPIDPEEEEFLTPEELADGWRLACASEAETDLTLELAQWGAFILSDEREFNFTPQEGLGVAVDLGTTTIVAQLIDLATGHVLSVKSMVNPQARFGSDIMSRIQYAVDENGGDKLKTIIREALGDVLLELLPQDENRGKDIRQVVIVGNTAMHHFFSGVSVAPLSRYPYESDWGEMQTFKASELGWRLEADPEVRFLPCIGGFVGSDLLAGIEAIGLHEKEDLTVLVDLGTNGEIVVGGKDGILCTSTAAGPAFEGGCISMGMRASVGAVSSAQAKDGELVCSVIGDVQPCGVCGSGLVDVVAAALDLNLLDNTGYITGSDERIGVADSITVSQKDVRELQLAKGAIAAGIRILLNTIGASLEDVSCVYLAGAFGNYMNRNSAQRIGMIRFPSDIIRSSGNTALLGAKMALFSNEEKQHRFEHILNRITHVSLSKDPAFQSIFIEEMLF